MSRPPTAQQIQGWLRQGERDLEAAQKNADIGLYDVCALFCQQAVEKHLKALYMRRDNREAPKTHKIADIADTLGAPQEFYALLQQLETDYMTTRYPDIAVGPPFEAYNEQIARQRLEGAIEVIEWAKRQIRSNT